jgi:hypothetical protein
MTPEPVKDPSPANPPQPREVPGGPAAMPDTTEGRETVLSEGEEA